MAIIEVKEQCKSCFHFQVCANVLKQQLYIREKMLKEENPKCEQYVPLKNVAEIKHGYWVHNQDHNAYESEYFCSVCLADGSSDTRGENYCYNCGARMDGTPQNDEVK